MAKGKYDGYDEIELFGSMLEEKRRAWCFQPEDEGEGIWIAKSIVDWDAEVGVLTMPKWLARKHKLIKEPPGDEHPAWDVILKPAPTFIARTITK